MDGRFQTREGRLANVAELDRFVAKWTSGQSRDELVSKLHHAGIASSPVLSVEEQWKDPQFEARHIKQTVDIPVYGKEDLFKAPWHFSDFSPQIERCGPLLGQHNDLVLGDLLGLSPEEIADLKQSGVVA